MAQCKYWNAKCDTCMALWGAITELNQCYIGHVVLEDANIDDNILQSELNDLAEGQHADKAAAPIYKLFLEIMLTLPVESRRAIMCTSFEVNRETGDCWWEFGCEKCNIPDLTEPI